MKKADQFSFPCQFTGTYPSSWAGYIFLQETTQNALHPGIDWNWGAGDADFNMPVQAVGHGVCVHTSKQEGIGYGTIIVLKHELTDQLYEFIKSKYSIDTHTIYSFYAHLNAATIKLNQEVLRGTVIGNIGKSGTTASHLHQELYKPIPGTSWRYWPTLKDGWDKERLKKYYINTHDLVVNQPSPLPATSQPTTPQDTTEKADAFVAVASELGSAPVKDIVLAKIKGMQEEQSRLEDANQKVSRELTEKSGRVIELDAELNKIREDHEELKADTNKLIADNERLQKANVKLEGRINELTTHLETVKQPLKSGWDLIVQGFRDIFRKG
jgi:regulator of replication initiation timing